MADRYGSSAAALEECVPEIQEFLSRETIIELADQAEQKAVVAKRRTLLEHVPPKACPGPDPGCEAVWR